MRPELRELLHPPEAALLELGVADGEHLVHEQDLRLEVGGDREREPHVHPARVPLDRRVDERRHAGEVDDVGQLARDLAASHAEDRRRSGRCSRGRSAPGGSRCRPRAGCRRGRGSSAWPAVGVVIRVRSFSSVDLPAPLRPMTPSTSPCSTSKLTSLSAQISSYGCLCSFPVARGRRARATPAASRNPTGAGRSGSSWRASRP